MLKIKSFDLLVLRRIMSVTSPFWYAVFRGGGIDGTQYAKGWYAVRRN